MNNKDIIKEFVKSINEKNWDKLRRFVDAGFTRTSVAAGPIGSLEELIKYLQSEYLIFPDANEEILDMVSEGDKVAVRHRFSGTQMGAMGPYSPSGKKMVAQYLAIYSISGNKIVGAWVEWDNLSGLKQLGHIKE